MSLLLDTSHTSAQTDLDVGTPRISRVRDARLIAAGPRLWRLLDARGRVIGHLRAVVHGGDTRYRAQRFHVPSRAFRDLGEFWSADDAVECLAFAR